MQQALVVGYPTLCLPYHLVINLYINCKEVDFLASNPSEQSYFLVRGLIYHLCRKRVTKLILNEVNLVLFSLQIEVLDSVPELEELSMEMYGDYFPENCEWLTLPKTTVKDPMKLQ